MKRFSHLGEEWVVRAAGTGHVLVSGSTLSKISSWQVEFKCVSNSQKDPVYGRTTRPNPSEVPDDLLKEILDSALKNKNGGV